MTTNHPARRRFLRGALSAAGLAVALPARAQQSGAGSSVPQRPDPLPSPLVQEFVRKAHADLASTRDLLSEHPTLLNATWDWGGGDFETGLGGAGHMGAREIAEFLIGRGARLDIFAAAMLGRLDLVKAFLSSFPGLIEARGPHGISLLRHALAGGGASDAVVEYLRSLGARER